jgi:RsiW-degrading membrane proteinase PrsW (M82 family)
MPLLLALYRFVFPRLYLEMPDSSNILVSLVGFVFQVGIWEELCKILPVVAYLVWKRRRADPKASLMIGVFSGLGFAAFENLQYADLVIANTMGLAQQHGESGLYRGVEGAMINVLLRSLSLVFCHALFTGIFSYFLTVAFLTGRRYIALAITGLAVSATIHGVYDWLAGQQQTFAAMVMAASFVLFYAYLLKLKALAGDGPTLKPSAASTQP